MKNQNYSQFYKIIVVGDQGVGKTSFVKKISTGKLPVDPKSTIGVDFLTSSFTIGDGTRVKAQIWDTAGSEKYSAVTSIHYRKSHGAIVMYDLTNKQSFLNVPKWIRKVRELCQPQVVVMVIGNKSDLANLKISTSDIQQLSFRERILYDQISTREGNPSKPFEDILQQIYRVSQLKQSQKSLILRQNSLFETSQNQNCNC